mgnify:CR=1 FL=1
MPTAALHNKTVLFQRALGGSPDVFETIGEVTNYDGPSMSAPEIDVTSFDSTWAEKLVGLPDAGQVTIGFNWIPANGPQSRLREDFGNGTLRVYQLVPVSGNAIVFSAYVTAVSPSGAANEKMAGSATLSITGEPSGI